MNLERLAARFGGVLSRRQLLAAGLTDAEVRALPWRRVRHGWLASPQADDLVIRAVAMGGALACCSVLRRAGVWVPTRELHVRFPRNVRATKRGCQPYGRRLPVRESLDSIDIAIESAANCVAPETLVVVLDSMLNKRMIETADAATIVAASPHAHLKLADRCDSASESGLESIVRLRLRAHGIGVRTQVVIQGIGRVDLLVGSRLVIECDGREFHGDAFQSDRTRDRLLVGRGFIVIRLTYEDVMFRWETVIADILAVIRRRDHRKPAQMSVRDDL